MSYLKIHSFLHALNIDFPLWVMKLKYVLIVILVKQLTCSFHQGTVLRLKEYIKKVFFSKGILCGTAYSFENKGCRAGPADYMKHFTQMGKWICICLKDRKKSSKTKQNFSPYKLFTLEPCELVYSEIEDQIGCREFFFCFNSLFSYIHRKNFNLNLMPLPWQRKFLGNFTQT